jgi:RND superfamily putative drug exporter
VTPFAALGRFTVRFRWLLVVVWIVGAPMLAHFLPTLSSVSKSDNTSFLPANSPAERAFTLQEPFQPRNKSTALMVAARSDGRLTSADLAAIGRAESAVAGLGSLVAHVQDQGQSSDGQAARALVQLKFAGFSGGKTATDAVDAMRAAIATADPPPGLGIHLTGGLATFVDDRKATGHTQNVTQDLSVIFILVLLLLVFRGLLAPFVVLLPAALALVVAQPLIAEATHIGVQVSDLLQLLLVVIILGAGTDYGLFLIFRMREELRAGRSPHEAVIVAVTRVGESITFSGLTVIAALVSLLLASFGLYKGLGPGLAIGVAVVLVAQLTLLPALLALLGRAVFWPQKPTAGQKKRTVWGSIAARVVDRPVRTLTVGLAIFGALSLCMVAYAPGGFGAPTVSAKTDSSQGTAAVTAHYASAEANPTQVLLRFAAPVWDNADALLRAQQQLKASGQFTGVVGPLAPNGGQGLPPAGFVALYRGLGTPYQLAKAPSTADLDSVARLLGVSPDEASRSYRAFWASQFAISRDGTVVQYQTALTAGDPGSNDALNAVPRIRDAVASVAANVGAVDNGVAGQAAALHDVATVSAHDLAKVIPFVLLVLGILLAIVLRSLVAPLYLVASVALSYLAALGLTVLVFVIIGGQNGINFVLPFFMFIFILALGEDYNILVMSRIREEAHRWRLKDAVHRAVEATGTTVTSAGIILAGTFAVLTVAGGQQVQEIGFGLAVGVLLDTFFVRTLLVPSTVVLIGRWNWWPSKLSHEHHDDIPPPEADEPAGEVPVGVR